MLLGAKKSQSNILLNNYSKILILRRLYIFITNTYPVADYRTQNTRYFCRGSQVALLPT